MTATLIERDIVTVSGADAGEYLQTQLTKDILSLGAGESTWSFLLEPKSEIVALLRVTRMDEDGFMLDVEPGWGDVVRKRIDGFLFRMDVSFEQDTWPGLAWRGGSPQDLGAPIVAALSWDGVEGVDVVGPEVKMPRDAAELDSQGLEALRIAAGWPRMGAEIDDKATPAMTGLINELISFDKGCYTGQEFVARVHYREADPPRRLIRISFDGSATISAGDPIVVGGDQAGAVTSSSRGIALGFLKRAVETPSLGIVGDVEVQLLSIRPE
jgi:folate-binding protein YgfZ